MPKRMVMVGGFPRLADGKEGDGCGDEVEAGVDPFRDHADRVSESTDHELNRGQEECSVERGAGG